ncbi:UDP-N-acetylglucosamine transferase subunit ALG13 homolog [Tetranychus urticae]|uniref:UDP-N-acetylglucosamine transferase subunit ALG13 n=1 Tax=Tetranychus urticae TaxID=32264 RepID=T1KVE5_TETUR|nr:UDP-N-acetylglucosamine transferase subunit ALG13 homolog [Tetranychus urticae]
MDSIFVTVGTTRFDSLIDKILDPSTIKLLQDIGCKKLTIQKGSSPAKTLIPQPTGIDVEVFDYAPTIIDHIEKANFVIGHSGAGTILDVLRCGKPLLVVINDSLMDNHQTELADKLSAEGFLKSCTVDTLKSALKSFNSDSIKKFPAPNLDTFPKFLDKVFQF